MIFSKLSKLTLRLMLYLKLCWVLPCTQQSDAASWREGEWIFFDLTVEVWKRFKGKALLTFQPLGFLHWIEFPYLVFYRFATACPTTLGKGIVSIISCSSLHSFLWKFFSSRQVQIRCEQCGPGYFGQPEIVGMYDPWYCTKNLCRRINI